MERTVIKIDEEKCTGCGLCVKGCHEGALQLINGKAVLISELYCDGLGACIGDCPEEAIILEKREATPYSETAVMERLVEKGETVIRAHLKHLQDHKQTDLVNEGLDYLKKHSININMEGIGNNQPKESKPFEGCPGSRAMSFKPAAEKTETNISGESELQQWPVQLHLLSPQAPYLKGADLLLAADCSAFAVGDFHNKYLKGKKLAIACPKLDSEQEIYVEKLVAMIDQSELNTLTVMIMEVPCCGGLLRIAQTAVEHAERKIPLKLIVVSLQGEKIKETWV